MTEREVVLRERAAFLRGRHAISCSAMMNKGRCPLCEVDAAALYPLPTVTRPRVVRIGNKEYRLHGKRIEFRVPCDGATWCEHSAWRECQQWQPSTRTPEEVKALTDLLANPTETVEA